MKKKHTTHTLKKAISLTAATTVLCTGIFTPDFFSTQSVTAKTTSQKTITVTANSSSTTILCTNIIQSIAKAVDTNTTTNVTAKSTTINIQNTANLATGLYAISVGCYSNGKYFEFKDAIQINMLLAVPEGVTVTPAEVVVKMEDKNWWEASAQVTTDTEKHVSITGYAIAEDESKEYLKYFTISDDGIITFNPEKKDNIIPGEKYVISLKLKTKAGEHLYADAVTFNVISKPLKLQYAPNEVRVEKNIAHESQLPTIQGSSEGRTYTIKSITPEISGFTIDAATGKISIAENTLTQIGNVYEVDVTVTNEYGTSDFPKAYIVTVVDFINPIDPETFKYEVPETYEGKGYTIPLINEFKGDEVIFDFAEDNSDIIKEQIEKNRISIDKVNGTITIAENNTLTPEDYTVKVKAANPKGEVSSSFTLTIKENPNKFTSAFKETYGSSPTEFRKSVRLDRSGSVWSGEEI